MKPVCRRRPRAAWIAGSAQPYESFWILLHKFILLNRPVRSDLGEIFTAFSHQADGLSPSEHTEIGLFPSSLRLHPFASILGERRAKLQYCTGLPFQKSQVWLFDSEMRHCPCCLEHGFHTVLFSVRGMAHCPIHQCPLSQTCPKCSQPFENHLTTHVIEFPGRCRCGHVFLPANFLTFPQLPRKALRVFDPLVRWLHACNDKVAFDIGAIRKTTYFTEELESHLPHWQEITGVFQPPFLSSPQSAVLNVVRYDYPVNSPGKGATKASDRPYTAIYKSLRRQLTKNYLHNRLRDYVALSDLANAVVIRNEVIAKGRAPHAFALLLWRQCIEGWRSLSSPWEQRTFTREREDYWSYAQQRWMRAEITGIRREALTSIEVPLMSAAELRWLDHRLFAQGLMDMWHQTIHKIWAWLLTGQHYYGQVRAVPEPFSSCSCVRNPSGTLTLLLRPAFSTATCRRDDLYKDKAMRIYIERERIALRWRHITERLKASPFVLVWSPDIGWATQPVLFPSSVAPLDMKQRRLLLPGQRLHFILFLTEEGRYAARLLEFPIQTYAGHTQKAILQLKHAVTAYLQTNKRAAAPPV